MPDCGGHYLWFAFVCFLIRSHPPFLCCLCRSALIVLPRLQGCFFPHKLGRSYGVVATDIILSGLCFLHRHMSTDGELPRYCVIDDLGFDVHPRAYSYSHAHVNALQHRRALHFQHNLQLPEPPKWVTMLPKTNVKLELVLPWAFDVDWVTVDDERRMVEIVTRGSESKFQTLMAHEGSGGVPAALGCRRRAQGILGMWDLLGVGFVGRGAWRRRMRGVGCGMWDVGCGMSVRESGRGMWTMGRGMRADICRRRFRVVHFLYIIC